MFVETPCHPGAGRACKSHTHHGIAPILCNGEEGPELCFFSTHRTMAYASLMVGLQHTLLLPTPHMLLQSRV